MLLQKKMSPHCAPSETEKNHEKHTTVHCIHWSVILRGQLYSHRSFVLLPLLSSTQLLFPSNKYRTAHKQFVIGGNEFLIIETDNVLWHLEQCCSALLRARASPNVIIVATIIYQCQLGWGVSNWWMQSTAKCIWDRSIFSKGQLILKCLFGVFNFSQKTNKNKSTWGIILVVKSNLFVLWENWRHPKTFQN